MKVQLIVTAYHNQSTSENTIQCNYQYFISKTFLPLYDSANISYFRAEKTQL